MTTTGTPPRPVTPVAILAALLDGLAARIDDSELRRARDLAVGLDPYVERMTTSPSPELAALADRTAAEPWAGTLEQEMLSGHVEGQLLATLVHATRARRVLEVGMFTGYSALAMAEALPADGELIACEVDEHAAGIARDAFAGSPHGHKIDVRVGPAQDTLATLAGPVDLVFIDADKAAYPAYLNAALPLLAAHGLIAVDNTLMQGEPYAGERSPNGEAIAAFNDAVAADPRVEQVVVPVRDGLTLIRRKDA